jgi:hypothetical protein
MTSYTVSHTRPALRRRPGARDGSSWQVPLALVVLSLIPVVCRLSRSGVHRDPPPRRPPDTSEAGGPHPRSVGGVAMNQRHGPHAPDHYEVRIEGHLDDYWAAWFGGLTLIREDDGTTTLRGAVTDQAELHGLLAKLRDLGTTLISVKTIDAPGRRHVE